MSVANPQPDSVEDREPEASDDAVEPPTQPWHLPPVADALSTLQPEFDASDFDAGSFDFHDTIPAPPWLDEPLDALEAPAFPAR